MAQNVPEDKGRYVFYLFKHTFEGPDDMTSHIKSSVLGSSVNFPIKDGVPLLGVWQGIYLCEHRNGGKVRKIIITSHGEN